MILCQEQNESIDLNETGIHEQGQMTAKEKKHDLYLRQKQLLDTFLEHGAISRAQYDKSLGDLTVKMGMKPKDEAKV